MSLFVPYHMHSDLSLLDSCTKFQEYVDLAAEEGLKAISISEHGKQLNWVDKWAYCRKKGIKYIHSVEIYLTETLDEKVKDNYHTVLIAKNQAGVVELNNLVAMSTDADHFYYKNRLSFDEFLRTSDNIISTSACLASPLNKLDESHPMFDALAEKYTFYEVQPHAHDDQVAFNKKLVKLSKRFGKKLIAATDAHASTKYKAECRRMLMLAKRMNYDETGFDMVYKSYDEFVAAFAEQGALTEVQYLEAIANTNLLDEMCEEIELDTETIKYPVLYGSHEHDAEVFKERTDEMFEAKLRSGIIPPNQEQEFRDEIEEEKQVLLTVNMGGFMLIMSETIQWCRDHDIPIGTARGSVGGSAVAYVLGITDLNSITWNTVFSRFCNVNRIEPGDIDIDCREEDRPKIFEYLVNRFGSRRTARVSSYGTLKEKAVIDEIGRAMKEFVWKEQNPDEEDGKNPWTYSHIDKIKEAYDSDPESAKEKYPELFYYFDGMIGTRVSQSVHPAGMIVSSTDLVDTYGTFKKDGEDVLMLDMDAAHYVQLVKFDFLVLKTVAMISEVCRMIGSKYPLTHEIDFNDKAVWQDLLRSNLFLFQYESQFAGDCLRKLRPTNIHELSLVNAAIRPSGASYRDRLLARRRNQTPSPLIDEILSESFGYLVYQEQIIAFLQQVCGLSGSEADSVRRGISKKKMEVLEEKLPEILDGYCDKSDKPREVSEEEAKEFLQVIIDSSSYGFGKNHAIAYSLLAYLCAYYRYYHPGEFVTACLNTAKNDEDIVNGAKLAKIYGLIVTTPKFGFSGANYTYNPETRQIGRGLESIKFISNKTATTLKFLADGTHYDFFIDLLSDIAEVRGIDNRQIEILIKLEFFDVFGNQRELHAIRYFFNEILKSGKAKSIKKEKVRSLGYEELFAANANGKTKQGGESASWTNLDMTAIMHGAESAIKAIGMPDMTVVEKAKIYASVAGYAGYITGEDADRSILYVKDVKPIKNKRGHAFKQNVSYQSLGSGKEGIMSVDIASFAKDPIRKGDIIRCFEWRRKGRFFDMLRYEHM